MDDKKKTAPTVPERPGQQAPEGEAGEREFSDGESLDEAFQRLDGMIRRLEDKETSLEESFRIYREGMTLLKDCADRIDLVEKAVQQLEEDGGISEFDI